MPDDDLSAIFESAGVDATHLGPEELSRLAARITTDPGPELILLPPRVAGLFDLQDRPPDFLEIHDREWWLDATDRRGRQYLRNLLAATAIADTLGLYHTLTWLSAVLSATATVEAVTVDDRGVHFTVARIPSPELPAELADDINPQDFAEFVAILANAGPVVPLPVGGTVSFTDSAR
ncbi:hypothetical protein GCM10029963_74910 [Micromonospora andamanensis]|uniref:hypothetical protein n=1 Tax=Micromonospora andamanensis TaxID=1287068 RepID=UPI00194F9A43|nr:hypothetical protein [Micromonospora andamanensis]GIJ42685.1 hypothetical protein Vwe01_60100 [Micromonospora andamanensis]